MGPAELLVIFSMLVLSGMILGLWAVVDALRHPQAAWDSIGESRTAWILVIVAGLFFGGLFGLILSLVYLLRTRPKLQAVTTAGA